MVTFQELINEYKRSDFSRLSVGNFQKLKNVSEKKEVKMIMDIEKRLLEQSEGLARNDKDLFSLTYFENKQSNITTSRQEIKENCVFSIAGGYSRNILLGTIDPNTDVDLIVSLSSSKFIKASFKEIETDNRVIGAYEIPDNSMHTIFNNYDIKDLGNSYVKHRFVSPFEFDFTINLGCICSRDGYLYAPPATIYDIENKILRGVRQLSPDYHINSLLNLSFSIRAVRFALKYDMTIHNDVYSATEALFSIQRDRESIDDLELYHSLKHILNDPEPLRDDIFITLKKLGMFETEKYSNFSDFYSYVEKRFTDKKMRVNKVVVGDRLNY